MQSNIGLTPYIGDITLLFLPCWTNVSLFSQAMWQHVEYGIELYESAHVDLMDFVLPDRDQSHMIKSEPLIALVRSNGCNLIFYSANDRATRGCLWTL